MSPPTGLRHLGGWMEKLPLFTVGMGLAPSVCVSRIPAHTVLKMVGFTANPSNSMIETDLKCGFADGRSGAPSLRALSSLVPFNQAALQSPWVGGVVTPPYDDDGGYANSPVRLQVVAPVMRRSRKLPMRLSSPAKRTRRPPSVRAVRSSPSLPSTRQRWVEPM